MRRSGRFERRLLTALILFSLVPTLVLVAIGTAVLREAVSLQTTPAGWERLGETGRALIEQAEGSGDAELADVASRHRAELVGSIQQAQRWGYLNRRLLDVIPWLSAGFVAVLGLLALRSARTIARDLSAPIDELVDWAGRVGRGEALPEPGEGAAGESDDFGVLRSSFRSMTRELERSRERELEAERMRAAVSIARGVAHELKNALTPLRFAVASLRRGAPPSAESAEALDVIDAESERLDGLARAFAQLGRPPEGPLVDIDLAELIEYLSRSHLPEGVSPRIQVASDLPMISGHYDALSRALGNLFLNASDAIGEGGGELIVGVAATGEGEVEIRIADSGPGLPAGAEDRIWDPDFSTKARGTGLGLALVRQTVLAHGGRISAHNRSGGGAEFKVVLPTVRDGAPARGAGD